MSRFYHIFCAIVLFAAVLFLQQHLVVHGEMLPERSNTTVYPTELYLGENLLTFSNPDGIQELRPLFDTVVADLVECSVLGDIDGCSDSVQMRVLVRTLMEPLNMRFVVTGCNKKRQILSMKNVRWILEDVVFPTVEVGDTACRPFRVRMSSTMRETTGLVVDSISPSASNIFVQDLASFPLQQTIKVNRTFTACFVAVEPGVFRFAMPTWIRREQPAGGFTNYQVADTGTVRVIPRKSEERPSPGERQ